MLTERFHQAPLKIAKTFPFDHQLGVYMMDVSPGMMDGDLYELDWTLREGSQVFLTNQSFTKVHPCPNEPAMQKLTVHLDQNCLLEYIPEPIMLYSDASFQGDTEVRLAEGSTLFLSEILCPGRMHRGEMFQYTGYNNRFSVFYGPELIYYNRQSWKPGEQAVQSIGMFEEFSHTANLYVFSDHLGRRHLEQLRADLDAYSSGSPIRYGVSLTYKHGLILTCLGREAWQLQHFIEHAWHSLRFSLLGLPPLSIKK